MKKSELIHSHIFSIIYILLNLFFLFFSEFHVLETERNLTYPLKYPMIVISPDKGNQNSNQNSIKVQVFHISGGRWRALFFLIPTNFDLVRRDVILIFSEIFNIVYT